MVGMSSCFPLQKVTFARHRSQVDVQLMFIMKCQYFFSFVAVKLAGDPGSSCFLLQVNDIYWQ